MSFMWQGAVSEPVICSKLSDGFHKQACSLARFPRVAKRLPRHPDLVIEPLLSYWKSERS